MANATIPDLTALGATVAAGDLLEIADISNANASRKVTQAELVANAALGTPTSLVGTNITGTAAGLTAGSVTNGVTAAANAAGAGLLWTSGGANKTAVATDTVTTLNATTANVTNLLPVSNDGAAIGASGTAFSDLFLASGGVINFNAGNLTLTHSAGTLTSNGAYVGTTGTFAATNSLVLGTIGSAVGNILVRNATSGTISVNPPTGALGAYQVTWPNAASTLPIYGQQVTYAGPTAARTVTYPDANFTVARTDAANTFTGVQTMTSPVLVTPAAFTTGGTITLAENTSIALDPAGSADGKWTGISVTGVAGYTQAFGDLVYLDPTDSRWELCDANSASGADGDSRGLIGMVVSTGTDGTACTLLLTGIIRADAKFPTFTVNNPIYVSETAGAVTQTQPTTTDVVIRIVGAALTADEMYFRPDFMWTTHT